MKQLPHVRSTGFHPHEPSAGRIAAPGQSDREHTERAILKTVLYSDLFDYPLTPAEISHYLIERPGSREEIQAILLASAWLEGRITQKDGFVTLRGRERLVSQRGNRLQSSQRLWRKARTFVRILGNLPFVRMVAVTGALSMDNSNEHDDVDLFIVTAPSRVWLARAMVVLLVHVGKLTPNTICPNYVISQAAPSIEPQTIYVAHEFVQMVPLYGGGVYEKMRSANPWITPILPNASHPLHVEQEYRPGWVARKLKLAAEWLFSGAIGDRLEAWEMQRKIRKFTPRAANSEGNVIFDRNQVKGHFDDHGARICSEYQRRLEEYQLHALERS